MYFTDQLRISKMVAAWKKHFPWMQIIKVLNENMKTLHAKIKGCIWNVENCTIWTTISILLIFVYSYFSFLQKKRDRLMKTIERLGSWFWLFDFLILFFINIFFSFFSTWSLIFKRDWGFLTFFIQLFFSVTAVSHLFTKAKIVEFP